jgi:hypothetical protein
MKPVRRPVGPARRVGVAIGLDSMQVVALRRVRGRLRAGWRWSCPLEPPPADGDWISLQEALGAMRERLAPARLLVSFALLPPLAHGKVVQLPPVRTGDVGTLMMRNVRRYFVLQPEAVLADARLLGRPRGAGVIPALAVAASERTVQQVVGAAAAAGVGVHAMTAASAAMVEAAREWLSLGRGRVAVALCAGECWEVVHYVGGVPHRVVPLTDRASAAALLERVAAAVRGGPAPEAAPEHVIVCGPEEICGRLAELLSTTPAIPLRSCGAAAWRNGHSASLAACGAALLGERSPQLLTVAVRERRRQRRRVQTAALSLAAALLIGSAAGVHLWGMKREVEVVQTRRAAMVTAVAQAVEARQTLTTLTGWLDGLRQLESAAAPRWSDVFASLATALPDSAHLLSFSGAADGIRIEGLAHDAHVVVPALQASPHFAGAAFAAPLRREGGDGRERFEIYIPPHVQPRNAAGGTP